MSTPWNFGADVPSPDGKHKLVFSELGEIAMSAPLGGRCTLVLADGASIVLSVWCGGPAVWDTQSKRVAIPTWTRQRQQRMAVVDIEKETLTVFAQPFRVLELKAFEGNRIQGVDSPIYKTITLEFDITQEEVEKVETIR